MKRRILSMLMVLCMIASLFPASAFADGDNTLDQTLDAAADTQPAEALEAFSEPEEPVIPVHEHAYVPIVTEPTCTTQGYTTYICACGDSYMADYTDALNHPQTIEVPEIPATDTTAGTTAGIQCAICGEILSGCTEIPMLQPAPANEQDAQTNAENGSETSTAVTIVFDISPADAEISVYSINEFGEKTEFDPGEDGSYLLLPGEYYYTLQAEGYTGIEEEKLVVSTSDETVIVSAALTLFASEEAPQPEEEEELELQLEDETEHKDSKEATIASGTCGNNLRWVLDDKGILTISGTGAMTEYSSGVLPPWNTAEIKIKSIVINKGITSISKYAFYYCTELKSVDMSAATTLTRIDKYAFSECDNLEEVVLPEGLTTIGEHVFWRCEQLKSIVLPKSIKTIDSYAFNYDTMNALYYAGSNQQWNSVSLDVVNELLDMRYLMHFGSIVPTSGTCGTNVSWSLSVDGTLTITGSGEMEDCGRLYGGSWRRSASLIKNVKVQSGVKSIGRGAFHGYINLETVNIAGTVTAIGPGAFEDCSNLYSVKIPSSVISIETYVFSGCDSILSAGAVGSGSNIEFGWTESIPNNIFMGCSSLSQVSIPKTIKNIGDAAFKGCNGLQEVVFDASYEEWIQVKIGSDNDALDNVIYQFPAHQHKWGDWALATEATCTEPGAMERTCLYNGETETKEIPVISHTPGSIVCENEIASTCTIAGSYDEVVYCTVCGSEMSRTKKSIAKLAHTPGEAVIKNEKPATCEAGGSYDEVTCCTVCRQEISRVTRTTNALGHDWDEGTVTREATPAVKGERVYTCNRNGAHKRTEEIEFTGIGGFCGENVCWVYDEGSGVLTIQGEGGISDYNGGTSPWYEYRQSIHTLIIGSGVTGIGSYAFYDCAAMTSATIPDGVADIGNMAFYRCRGLTEIQLPDSVSTIGMSAFGTCSGLREITLPEQLSVVPEYMLVNCSSLETVYLPQGISAIQQGGFAGCTSLKTLELPAALKTLGDAAFMSCQALEEIHIPSRVANIGRQVFNGCESLSEITVDTNNPFYTDHDGALYDKAMSTLLRVPGAALEDFYIPEGVMTIDEYAFYSCTGIIEVHIPASVKLILNNAFQNCDALKDVYRDVTEATASRTPITILANNEALENAAWHYLPDIGSGDCGENIRWNLDADGILYIEGSGEMSDYTNASSPWYGFRDQIQEVQFTGNITSVGNHVFQDCTNLSEIVIPEGVNSIGESTFSGCASLTKVTIPTSVTVIEKSAFEQCVSLSNVYYDGLPHQWESISIEPGNESLFNSTIQFNCIGSGKCGDDLYWAISNDGVLYISGTGTMYNYSKSSNAPWYEKRTIIRSAVIAEGVASIGKFAFHDCLEMQRLYIPGSVSSIGEFAFINCQKLTNAGSEDNDNSIIFSWRDSIPAFAFAGADCLKTVIIPDGITEIKESAFNECKALANVSLPNTLGIIGPAAFYNCTSLRNILLPSNVAVLEESCFSGCSILETITIPSKVKHISDYAFMGCGSLRAAELPEGLISFGTGSFAFCTSLSSFEIPNSVKFIGDSCFGKTTALKNIVIPDSVTELGTGVFTESGLRTIILSGELTSIPEGSFFKCKNLLSIEIPLKVREIGEKAFGECISLQSIILGTCVELLGPYAFARCSSLTGIELPYGVKIIGEYAFAQCSKLQSVHMEQGVKSIDAFAFSQCEVLNRIELPNSVENIGNGAFMGCQSLEEATLSTSLKAIPEAAFSNCLSLYEIIIPDGVTSIGDEAFSLCEGLYRVSLPIELSDIGSMSFAACTNLTSIIIPAEVRTIGSKAFSACGALKEIRFLGAPPAMESDCFKVVTANAYYPLYYGWSIGYRQNYGGTLKWSSYMGIKLEEAFIEMLVGENKTIRAIQTNGTTASNVVWSSSDASIATVDSQGVVTGRKVGKAIITATTSSIISASCEVTVLFSDVMDASAYFYEPVYWAVEKGVTAGTSPTTFSPYNPCTRGQIVTFLWKAMGSPEPSSTSNPFTDVSASDYFYKPVLWAKENGVTSGKTATTFEPYSTCTRGQIVTFLWKAMGSPEPSSLNNPFTDVSTTDYFFKPILWAKERGITSGTSATTFSPYNPCTRAQAMTFLYKAMH